MLHLLNGRSRTGGSNIEKLRARIMLRMTGQRAGMLPDKTAARYGYLLKGNDLQTVGLRKSIHNLMDSRGISGIAVNVADTGNLELNIDSPSVRRAKETVRMIRDMVRADFDPGIKIVKRNSGTRYRKIAMDLNSLNDLNLHNNLQYIRSGLYKPEQASLMPLEELRSGLMSRYRLKPDPSGVLRGSVPERAYRQLKGIEPMYSHFTPDKLVRDYDEALRLQQYHLSGGI